MNNEIISKILELSEKAKKVSQKYPKSRYVFAQLFNAGKSFVGIAGLRGIGKTTILKQRLSETLNSVYISLDAFENLDLFEIVKELSENYNKKEFLLDEIHYYKNWQKDLKKIYDFLDVKIYFTSSVSIDIIHSKIDLSRRVIVKEMYPFSFKEYIEFSKNKKISDVRIKQINETKTLQNIVKYDYLFKEYIFGGIIPAYLEEKNPKIFENILERIIERDLVFSLGFNGEDINNVKLMLEFIANSGIDGISYSSIARNLGITKYKSIKYVNALEKAFILNVIKPKGTNVTKEPKILFVPPFRNVYLKNKDFKENLGAYREEFLVENLKMNKVQFNYLKGNRGEKMPDYLLNIDNIKYIIEVGGQNKSRVQIAKLKDEKNKYILTYPSNLKIPYKPLIFVGFLKV
jgi:uncharacterized protein